MKTIAIWLFIASTWIGSFALQAGPTKKGNRDTADSKQYAQKNESNATPSSSPALGNNLQSNDGRSSISVPPITINSDKDHPIWGTTVKDGWDKALVIGTIGLVIIGGFGVLYAVRTLSAINRQAELQEANLAQWVDLKPLGLFVETTSKTEPPKEVTLNLRWRLLNNTSFPFTLQKVETKVAIGFDWEHFEGGEEDTIAPAKSSNNYFDFIVPFRLTKGQTKSFFENGVALSIATKVSYIDVSGYERDQFFGDWYDCGFPDKLEINAPLGKTSKWIRTEEGDGKPDIVRSRSKILVADENPNAENLD